MSGRGDRLVLGDLVEAAVPPRLHGCLLEAQQKFRRPPIVHPTRAVFIKNICNSCRVSPRLSVLDLTLSLLLLLDILQCSLPPPLTILNKCS